MTRITYRKPSVVGSQSRLWWLGRARARRGPGGGRAGRGLGSARLALPIVPYASHSTGLSNGSLLQNNCSPNT